jgi:hydroxymethylbilane synthase
MKPLVIGTRGSALALWQAEWISRLLGEMGSETRLQIIKTSGDKQQRGSLADKGGKGLFVKELETALLQGDVDLAVHSLKDVPTTLEASFVLAAFLPRADPRDCLVAPDGIASLEALPGGTVVGSCSPRRISQLLHQNPRVKVEALRGNVETRLNKVRSGKIGATFLAKAGLDRLGLRDDALIHPLSTRIMAPAAGQGIVAVETLAARGDVGEILSGIEDTASRYAAEAERWVVRGLGGSCVSPIAAYAEIEDGQIRLTACAGDPEGRELLREVAEGPVAERLPLADGIVERLLARGAAALIQAHR